MSRPLWYSSWWPSDVETAWALLTSTDFVQHRATVLGDDGQVVSREPTAGGGLVLSVSRRLPQGAPSPVQRFLPSDGRVRHTSEWSAAGPAGERQGRWRVEGHGVPADVTGTMRLAADGEGCRHVVEGTATVRIPVVAGKVERVLVELMEKLAAREAELIGTLLPE